MPLLDTHKEVERLRAASFRKLQAESLVDLFKDHHDQFVTHDELKAALERLEYRITIKMGVVITMVLGLFKAVEKFL